MFLMMEHNKDKYMDFLVVIHRFRLHYICCKWRHIVTDQVMEVEDNMTDVIQTKRQKTMDTETVAVYGAKITGCELSVETMQD